MNIRFRNGSLEIAIEHEADCIFWRSLFTEEFADKFSEKLKTKCSLKKIYTLFKRGIDSIEIENEKITFDWLTPMELVLISNPDLKKTLQEQKNNENSNSEKNRILVIQITNSESGEKINLPFPLKRDFNPPMDLFRNTIKRLRKYIMYLKKDRRPSARSNNTQMFITDIYGNKIDPEAGLKEMTPYSTKSAMSTIEIENVKLRSTVEKLMVEKERLKNDTGAVKLEEILDEKTNLEKEVKILRRRTDDLEIECAANTHLKVELRKKEKELKELKGLLRDYEVSKKLKVPMKQVTGNRFKRQSKNNLRRNRSLKNSISKNRFIRKQKIAGFGKSRKAYNPPVKRKGNFIGRREGNLGRKSKLFIFIF